MDDCQGPLWVTGDHLPSASAAAALAALVDELGALQKAALATQMETFGIERFQMFLLAALVMMVVIELIPDRIQRQVAEKRAAMHERWSAARGQ